MDENQRKIGEKSLNIHQTIAITTMMIARIPMKPRPIQKEVRDV